MTLIDDYYKQCENNIIQPDAQQLIVLQHLQHVYDELVKEQKRRFTFFKFLYQPRLVKGIYLWGGVGIGKTFILDCFYQSLPFNQKLRIHFHSFMQFVHDQLKVHQGKVDPLQHIAARIAKKTLVLCFDEFFVSDIADAMLLGRLLNLLFSEKVCLIATSNIMPNDLYKHGLQRRNFLPAIDLLKRNTEVMHIVSKIDYRLRHLKQAGIFYTPLDQKAEENMQKTFNLLTQEKYIDNDKIIINGRPIRVKKKTDSIVWFDFKEICSVPRSQHDYLVIAKKYNTVFISDIPVISEDATDTIRLFINLVDVLYDAKVKLVMSAAESVPELYSRGCLLLEYARTHSRLIEMQSLNYFFNDEG